MSDKITELTDETFAGGVKAGPEPVAVKSTGRMRNLRIPSAFDTARFASSIAAWISARSSASSRTASHATRPHRPSGPKVPIRTRPRLPGPGSSHLRRDFLRSVRLDDDAGSWISGKR